MTDLMSRQAAIEALLEKGQKSRRYKVGEIWELNFDEIREALATVPSAEPKKGKWIYVERREPQYDIVGVKTWGVAYRCPYCRFIHSVIEDFGQYSYCPNCGADMRGEE